MPTVSNILAIDPATQLGWAYRNSKGKIKSGSEDFHNAKWDSAGMRFYKFQSWLMRNFGGDTPTIVVYEAVEAHSSTYAAHAYGGYISILQVFCEEVGWEYTGVPVGTIKKYWTGKGNAKKDAMIHEARVRGFNPIDDNEADALSILHWGMEEYL